jgi:hypothetical protein
MMDLVDELGYSYWISPWDLRIILGSFSKTVWIYG